MYAIIKAGGKQHEVREGQELKVELMTEKEGDKIEFETLLVADEEGKDVKVGTPIVAGAKVTATVMEHGKSKKIMIVKFKSKSRYRRNVGHRQPYTKLKIEKISA